MAREFLVNFGPHVQEIHTKELKVGTVPIYSRIQSKQNYRIRSNMGCIHYPAY
jgi:hypothetical protein